MGLCLSGLDTVGFAAAKIMSGMAEIIVVGGTGLYIKCLVEGFDEVGTFPMIYNT